MRNIGWLPLLPGAFGRVPDVACVPLGFSAFGDRQSRLHMGYEAEKSLVADH
jgi:hypothetical protein